MGSLSFLEGKLFVLNLNLRHLLCLALVSQTISHISITLKRNGIKAHDHHHHSSDGRRPDRRPPPPHKQRNKRRRRKVRPRLHGRHDPPLEQRRDRRRGQSGSRLYALLQISIYICGFAGSERRSDGEDAQVHGGAGDASGES